MAVKAETRADAGRGWAWAAPLVLALVVGIAYSGSLGGPFVYDDLPSIQANPALHSLWGSVLAALRPAIAASTLAGRPLLAASFALNGLVGGMAVGGFHLANIAIHLGAGLLLWGILRRSLKDVWVAFFAALIWAVHPLQTESVTYMVQRAESLAGLFVLGSLYAFVRSVEGPGWRWRALSVISAAAAVMTKETGAVAPLLVLLYDRCFIAGTFGAALRRKTFYAGLFSTWLLLAALVASTGWNRGGSIGFGVNVSWARYEWNQCAAIVTYLRLAVLPFGQVFDYGLFDLPVWQGAIDAGVVLVAGLGAVWMLVRRPGLGFWAALFFLCLGPSTLVAGVNQGIAEHRVYVALVGVIVMVLLLIRRVVASTAAFRGAGFALAAACATLTYARNAVYHSASSLWADTVAKRPGNPAAHVGLGTALWGEGKREEAVRQMQEAGRLAPGSSLPWIDLGNMYAAAGQLDESADAFGRAAVLDPHSVEARYNLGLALTEAHRHAAAIDSLREAVRIAPASPKVQFALGRALSDAGEAAGAEAAYREAVRLQPDYADALYNLGVLNERRGAFGEAAPLLEAAARTDPSSAMIHMNLGIAYFQLGKADQALLQFREAVRCAPDSASAHENLSKALQLLGQEQEGASEHAKALSLRR